MKKFLYNIAVFCVFAVLVPGILAFSLPSNENNYLRAYGLKKERLRNLPPGRILLVGFSELAFGLDSPAIEKALGMPVVNCGIHGGLGLDIILDDAVNDCRKGDIVVVAPNYSLVRLEGQESSVPYLVDLFPEKWGEISMGNRMVALKGLYRLLDSKLQILFDRSKGKQLNGWEYNAQNFNEYGDEYAHRLDTVAHNRILPYAPPSKMDSEVFHSFIERLKIIEQKGCRVYLIGSVIQDESYEAAREDIATIVDSFTAAGYPYILSCEEVAVPNECLYNYAMHCNEKGTRLYTAKLIQALKEQGVGVSK